MTGRKWDPASSHEIVKMRFWRFVCQRLTRIGELREGYSRFNSTVLVVVAKEIDDPL